MAFTRISHLRLIHIAAIAMSFALCSAAIASQASHSEGDARITEGIQLLRSGDAVRAKALFDEVIENSPHSADALTWRGVSENQLQQYEAAESDFYKAIKITPSMLAAHYNLALSLIRLKKIDAAIEQLQIVVKAQPDSVQTRYNLAILFEGKGSWRYAADQLTAAHTLASADKGVTLHLLEAELQLRQFDAIGSLTSDLADPSTPLETQRGAATALIHAGRYAEAIIILESAHAHSPEDRAVSTLLARVLLVEDRADEAKDLLTEIPTQGDDAAQIAALNGVATAATHKIDEAIVLLKSALNQDPSLALAHNVLGFCLFEQGKYAEAAEEYGKASKLDSQRQLYARDAALAYQRANQPTEALVFAERASSFANADASDHFMLGKLYVSANRNEDALHELLRAAELNPNLDSADYLLARTYMKLGDAKQAAIWSERLSALKQKHETESARSVPHQSVGSSTLLTGGSLTSDDAGAP